MKKEQTSRSFKGVQYLRLLKHNIAGSYYLWLGNRQKDHQKKYEIYKSGLTKNPHHLKLNYKMATYASNQKKWRQSAKYWKEVYRYYKYMKPEQFVEYAIVLEHRKNRTKAFSVLKKGLVLHTRSDVLADYIIKHYVGKRSKKAKLTLSIFKNLIQYVEQNPSIFAFEHLLTEAIQQKWAEEAKYLLKQAIVFAPEKTGYFEELAFEILILSQSWDEVKQYLSYLIQKGTDKQFDYQIMLQMIYQYTGSKGEARLAFSRFLEDEAERIVADETQYRKIILFDNGDSRIEYYKQLKRVNKVMLTFDSLNMVWDGPSFAFRLLIKQDIDIIAVRKREHRGYQQDLERDTYLNIIQPLLTHYDDVMCYGFSLGAYQALYHASHLNCRILAISPRLSIHPKYGKPKVAMKHHLNHELSFTKNDEIEPVIFYDPKNAIDRKFMEKGILPYFPNAKIIKMPYAGHMIAPYLRDAGQLKSVVQTFIDGETPTFNLKGTDKPARHYYHLSRECLKKNHLRWALDIVNRYLSFNEQALDGIKLKCTILIRQGKSEEVTSYLQSCIEREPENMTVYQLLAEHYIATNQRVEASHLIEEISDIFNKEKVVLKLQKKLKETYDE